MFRITSTSGLIMYQICVQLLHVFSIKYCAILNKLFLVEVFFVVTQELYKRFLRKNKHRLKHFLTLLYSVFYKNYAYQF